MQPVNSENIADRAYGARFQTTRHETVKIGIVAAGILGLHGVQDSIVQKVAKFMKECTDWIGGVLAHVDVGEAWIIAALFTTFRIKSKSCIDAFGNAMQLVQFRTKPI